MTSEAQRIQAVAENLRLIEKHITLHWLEKKNPPAVDEIKAFRDQLHQAVKELQDLHKMLTVFK